MFDIFVRATAAIVAFLTLVVLSGAIKSLRDENKENRSGIWPIVYLTMTFLLAAYVVIMGS